MTDTFVTIFGSDLGLARLDVTRLGDLPAVERAAAPEGLLFDLPLLRAQSSGEATYMNGVRVDAESYGIAGALAFDPRLTVYGNDVLFTPAEPRNQAPLELLIHYQAGMQPRLVVFDWGVWAKTNDYKQSYVCLRVIDENVFQEIGDWGQLPDGRKIWIFPFFNGYSVQENRNVVVLKRRANQQWVRYYASPIVGRPPPCASPDPNRQPSGWAVVEWKRFQPLFGWPTIPNGVGHGISGVFDGNGRLIPAASAGLRAVAECNEYNCVFQQGGSYLYNGPR